MESLIRLLPPSVTPVGVFVRPTGDEVNAAIAAGTRVTQVHGTSGNGLPISSGELWLAASLTVDGIAPSVAAGYTVLLDTGDPERFGGTCQKIDWGHPARVA